MGVARGQTIDELLAKYELHPEFRDIYVEGESDQGLVQWFLEQNHANDVNVYPITSFEIPPQVVATHGLTYPSNRSNAMALGIELEKRFGRDIRVRCIVDSDFDRTLKNHCDAQLVFVTDYTSMEMYAYNPVLVQKLLRIIAPRVQATGEEILGELRPILESLYAIRAANIQLGYGLSWVSFERCCTYKASVIRFDEDELLRRYLNTNGHLAQYSDFKLHVEALKSSFDADARHNVRGHDFIDVLTWFLRQRPSCRYLTVDSVRQVLYSAITSDQLKNENLFKKLLASVRP